MNVALNVQRRSRWRSVPWLCSKITSVSVPLEGFLARCYKCGVCNEPGFLKSFKHPKLFFCSSLSLKGICHPQSVIMYHPHSVTIYIIVCKSKSSTYSKRKKICMFYPKKVVICVQMENKTRQVMANLCEFIPSELYKNI